MVNAAGIAGVSQDFNGQGRKLDEVSQSTDQAVITDHPGKVLNISLTTCNSECTSNTSSTSKIYKAPYGP